MGTALKKRIFVGGISRTSYLSALRSQARMILFSSDMSFLHRFDPFLGSLWILCVVVVHHAFAQELIRHVWGAAFGFYV